LYLALVLIAVSTFTSSTLRYLFVLSNHCIALCDWRINTQTPISGERYEYHSLECRRLGRHRPVAADVSGQPGRRPKGDLSRFIEEAVRAHILELSAEQAKAANAHLSEAELTNAVDEALDWARKR